MSYTAPTYVDTKEQAILALASTIADEDKSALGNGSVNRALDILADVLAQQDVSVPQTNAGAILALAQYVTGGGGGGGGDFTTANVTLVCATSGLAAELMCACADDELNGSNTSVYLESGSMTFKAVLYKDKCFAATPYPYSITVSGDAEVTDPFLGALTITGDCTITLADAQQ